MNNLAKFNEYRKKYTEIIFDKYSYEIKDNKLLIKYHYEIPKLSEFNSEYRIPIGSIKEYVNKQYLDYLIFQVGMIELLSYIKCVCPENIIIKASYISEEQIKFFKKIYYNGLGEYLYINGINIEEDDLFKIKCQSKKIKLPKINYKGEGNLICVGGGKDSCVTLEMLKNEKNNSCFIINAKSPSIGCALAANYKVSEIIRVTRLVDPKIIDLEEEGYLKGHSPFSALIAFLSFLTGYLLGKKNIITSNESSSNEPTVTGTKINHQYSKSYEFENDFTNYINRYIKTDIKYFSLLRGLTEYKIAELFSKYKKYHQIFRSCNIGGIKGEWVWCCNCAKCLFIYIILSPFLSKKELIEIFGEDLLDKKELKETFIEILGYGKNKPFECVGTYKEARYAVSKVINENKDLSYLLRYYKENYKLELDDRIVEEYNKENNIDEYFSSIINTALNK